MYMGQIYINFFAWSLVGVIQISISNWLDHDCIVKKSIHYWRRSYRHSIGFHWTTAKPRHTIQTIATFMKQRSRTNRLKTRSGANAVSWALRGNKKLRPWLDPTGGHTAARKCRTCWSSWPNGVQPVQVGKLQSNNNQQVRREILGRSFQQSWLAN